MSEAKVVSWMPFKANNTTQYNRPEIFSRWMDFSSYFFPMKIHSPTFISGIGQGKVIMLHVYSYPPPPTPNPHPKLFH